MNTQTQHGESSLGSSVIMKKYEVSCPSTPNIWGGVDLTTPLLRKLEIEDPNFYSQIQIFFSILNYDGKLGERCSLAILMDLFFGSEVYSLNPFAVVNEIKLLEQQNFSPTKRATKFKGKHLSGLWHKHYMNGDIASLAKNVQNALDRYGISFLDEKRKAQAAGNDSFITKEDVVSIVNDVVTNNLSRRRKEAKMTGEWIIYAQHNNQNFYLCLAKHGEADEEIRAKIERTCKIEFPFLKEVLR